MVSKAQLRATAKYEKAKYWRPTIRLPKEAEEQLRQRAESQGKSINSYIADLVLKDLGIEDNE